MSARHRSALFLLCGLLAGCATGYTLVVPGYVTVGDLRVRAEPGWNRAPAAATPWARPGTRMWTRNGVSLDRLVIISGVPDGEPIFARSPQAAYPVFRSHMAEPELRALVAETIELAQGANHAVISTGNVRPHRFGRAAGILFDLDAAVLDGPKYRGIAAAIVADGRLHLLYFLGAVPYYFDEHAESAAAIIQSAAL